MQDFLADNIVPISVMLGFSVIFVVSIIIVEFEIIKRNERK